MSTGRIVGLRLVREREYSDDHKEYVGFRPLKFGTLMIEWDGDAPLDDETLRAMTFSVEVVK